MLVNIDCLVVIEAYRMNGPMELLLLLISDRFLFGTLLLPW